MEDQQKEWLVILEKGGGDTRAQLPARVSVTHVTSPTVLVVSSERDEATELSRHPGVRRVWREDMDAEDLESDEAFRALSRTEALAVRAWLQRHGGPEKHRPGNGLSWDAEGFQPPDPPPRVENATDGESER